ncbi:hypothetical protein WN51_11273 [Melipona quadrifasciata]|uniref:Uncharacterized protein n=1 Tax=Melipona quadrifasciata TaxID=166423 RepID=A0A0M9A454_9HYME|nr:hypothetical protein WN51_11273 [Melipona quadrifasciata]
MAGNESQLAYRAESKPARSTLFDTQNAYRPAIYFPAQQLDYRSGTFESLKKEYSVLIGDISLLVLIKLITPSAESVTIEVERIESNCVKLEDAKVYLHSNSSTPPFGQIFQPISKKNMCAGYLFKKRR